MKHLHTFERFLNEAKKFEFSFDYNTDEDDVKHIQNILDKAGCKAVARAGLDMEEMFVDATNVQDLAKAKKAIQKDGFQINESRVNEAVEYSVGDFPIGAEVYIGDEVWKVIKPGSRGEKIIMVPFNADAKRKYISIAIEFDLNWLNANITNISK